MSRQHDAELCERIRVLEKEVAELKAELESHRAFHPTVYPYYVHPWPYPTTIYPSFTSSSISSPQFTITGGNS